MHVIYFSVLLMFIAYALLRTQGDSDDYFDSFLDDESEVDDDDSDSYWVTDSPFGGLHGTGTEPLESPGGRMCINPTSGLPMMSGDESGFDCGGNSYCQSSCSDDFTHIDPIDTSSAFDTFDSFDAGGMSGFD
jgi:hypothetical protein